MTISGLIAIVGLVSSGVSGFIFMDDRHQHVDDAQVAAAQTSQMVLDVRIDVLQQQIDMLEDRPSLSQREQERWQDMKSELKSIKEIKLKYQTK